MLAMLTALLAIGWRLAVGRRQQTLRTEDDWRAVLRADPRRPAPARSRISSRASGVVLIALLVVETYILGRSQGGLWRLAGRPWAWPSRGRRWRSGGSSG